MWSFVIFPHFSSLTLFIGSAGPGIRVVLEDDHTGKQVEYVNADDGTVGQARGVREGDHL